MVRQYFSKSLLYLTVLESTNSAVFFAIFYPLSFSSVSGSGLIILGSYLYGLGNRSGLNSLSASDAYDFRKLDCKVVVLKFDFDLSISN